MKNLFGHNMDVKQIALTAVVLLLVTLLIFQLPVGAANTFPHEYELVSVNNVDGQGVDRLARVEGVSADGTRILFSTTATNLPHATSSIYENGGYIRDMNTATTTRIDLSASGVAPDRSTSNHVMNTTGRYVAFASYASNLIDGLLLDSSIKRVYIKDLQTSEVELITDISGPSGSYDSSLSPIAVSDDGRYVVISTYNINKILPGTRIGSGNYVDMLLYDREKSVWTLLNKPVDGAMQGQHAVVRKGGVSCDGSFIVFHSAATNLADNHSGSGIHVYLADLRNGLRITDITPNTTADSHEAHISCNGRYVTYSTKDRTLISPTPVGMSMDAHLVRYDRLTGGRMYVDSASNNATFDAYQASYIPSSISDTGDIVLAYSTDTSPYNRKIYFKHLSDDSGTLESVQHNYAGLSYDPAVSPTFMISSNGEYVAVSSDDSGVLGLPGSKDVNGDDIYNVLRIKTGL